MAIRKDDIPKPKKSSKNNYKKPITTETAKLPDPGSDKILSPRAALRPHEMGDVSLSEYVDYLNTFNIQQCLGIPDEEFYNSLIWPHRRKVLAHLDCFGSISQKTAALVYDIWRLSAVVEKYNKAIGEAGGKGPWMGSRKYPCKSGGQYSVYFLTDTRPEKLAKNQKKK